MTAWQPIKTAPRDRAILVRAGEVFVMAKNWLEPEPMSHPALVCWKYYDKGRGWWLIPDTPVQILKPKEWTEIPE